MIILFIGILVIAINSIYYYP